MSEVDIVESGESAERGVALQSVGAETEAAAGLDEWTERMLRELSPDVASLVVRLVAEEEMRSLNRTYRSIDAPTDVLSFPGEPSPEGRHLGDIVIAVSVAERQANERGQSLATELKILVLHGVLHCLGYDHEVDGGEMDELEADLRCRFIPELSSHS